MGTDEVTEEDKEPKIYPLWQVLLLVFVIWLLFSFSTYFFTSEDWTEKGQFGDMFGFVNSLFSGLAFAGLIYTIFLQKNELHLQRVELRETREVFKDQSSLMEVQKNISIFFSMIENHRGLVNSFSRINRMHNSNQTSEIIIRGYEYFNEEFEKFSRLINHTSKNQNKTNSFSDFYDYHPVNIFSKSVYLLHIYMSIESIIIFIKNYLDNDEIYHNVFYNAMSLNEKSLLSQFALFDVNGSYEKIKSSNYIYFDDSSILSYLERSEIPIIKFDIVSKHVNKSITYQVSTSQRPINEIYSLIEVTNLNKENILIKSARIVLKQYNGNEGKVLEDVPVLLEKDVSSHETYKLEFEKIFNSLFINPTNSISTETEIAFWSIEGDPKKSLKGDIILEVSFKDKLYYAETHFEAKYHKNAKSEIHLLLEIKNFN